MFHVKPTRREVGAGMGTSPITHFLRFVRAGYGRVDAHEAVGSAGQMVFQCAGCHGRKHVYVFDTPGAMVDMAARLTVAADRWAHAADSSNRRRLGVGR